MKLIEVIGLVNGMERWTTDQEYTFLTHSGGQCFGQNCCIHNPSDTHMKDWPLNWRSDRGMMERICEHGVGHPDPDDYAYHKSRNFNGSGDDGYGVHGCDFCCMKGDHK